MISSDYINNNRTFVNENISNIDVIFNDELSLTTDDLKDFLQKLPNVTEYGPLGGIASMNGITKHLKTPKLKSKNPLARYQALIVNTADLLEPGEHWFLMGTDWGNKNKLEGDNFYFDSYGRSLETIYTEAGTPIPKNLDLDNWHPINKSAYQSLGTNACGYYMLSLLHLMNSKNESPQSLGQDLDEEYMNKKSHIFQKSLLLNLEAALSNDLQALKNAEFIGKEYTPTANWYKKLQKELYQ